MTTTLSLRDFAQAAEETEIKPRTRRTALEEHAPSLSLARSERDETELAAARIELLRWVVANSAKAVPVTNHLQQGRRYAAFELEDVMVKVLMNTGMPGLGMWTTRRELEGVMRTHMLEHAVVDHFFPAAVPDTLFYREAEEGLIGPENHLVQMLQRYPFLLQERIVDGVSLEEAVISGRFRSERFRDSAKGLIRGMDTMAETMGKAIDVPDKRNGNLQVDDSGSIWVVDTNTLVHPDQYPRLGFKLRDELLQLIDEVDRENQ